MLAIELRSGGFVLSEVQQITLGLREFRSTDRCDRHGGVVEGRVHSVDFFLLFKEKRILSEYM